MNKLRIEVLEYLSKRNYLWEMGVWGSESEMMEHFLTHLIRQELLDIKTRQKYYKERKLHTNIPINIDTKIFVKY